MRDRIGKKASQDADTAIKQEQDDIGSTESRVLTGREPAQKFEEMLDAIRVSLSDLISSDTKVDGEDDEDTEQGKLSEHDEPNWVMQTIPKMVNQRMQRLWQKQMNLEESTQP